MSLRSQIFREQMLSKNLYSPRSVYDLNKDQVTKTLNEFQKYGINLRASLLVNTVEKIVDDTAMTKIAFEQYAKAMAAKAADNIIHHTLPSVNLDNIFSNDPNKKILTTNTDWHITTPTGGNVFKDALGILDKEQIQAPFNVKGDRESEAGGSKVFNHTGDAQKGVLIKQLAENDFNRFAPQTRVDSNGQYNGFKNTNAVYSEEFVEEMKEGSVYTSYIRDNNDNTSLDAQDKDIKSLGDAIISRDFTEDILIKEGFGTNNVAITRDSYANDETLFLTFIDENGPETGMSSEEKMAAHGVKRGLLYYTQQIVDSTAAHGKNIAHNRKEYYENRDGSVLYKGSSECRSFTIFEKYDNVGRLMRYEGNGHDFSVVKDSVMPKIYPKTSADTRNMMFSIENLAFTRDDMMSMGVPQTQWGPNKGRIMWFPPYGLNINSDNSSANYEETRFLGRIEPVYTLNGSSRDMSISFMLIIDTPPNVHDYSKDQLASWFAGCLDTEPIIPKVDVPLIKKDPNPTGTTVTPTEKPKKVTYTGAKPTYFYQNDIHVVDADYEKTDDGISATGITDSTNMFALNKNFDTELEALVDYAHSQIVDGYELTIDIVGKCSALWKDDYNAKLSYKRANALMHKFCEEYSWKYTSIVVGDARANDTFYETNVKLSFVQSTPAKAFTFKTSDNLITFKISGKGEQYANGSGSTEGEINKREVKMMRSAAIAGCSGTYVQGRQEAIDLLPTKPTSLDITNQQSQQAAIDNSTSNSTTKKKEWFGNDHAGVFATGWEKVDYYKPVFHSQTPHDFSERLQFLRQLTRPRNTIDKMNLIGSNSMFGKMPVCVLRIGDFVNSKVIVKNVAIDFSETPWDVNPEGMGMQPMIAKVTLDLSVIGGMALEFPVNKLLTATDFNHYANSDYYDKMGHYPKNRFDYQYSVRPEGTPDANKEESFKVFDLSHPKNQPKK